MKNLITWISMIAIILIWFTSIKVLAAPPFDKPTPKSQPEATPEGKSGNPGGKKGKAQNFKGSIAGITDSALMLTLKDNRMVTVTFNEVTKVKIPTLKNATINDIILESQVMVQARANRDGDLLAQKIQVIPGQPTRIHRVGVVTAYSAGSSITVKAKDGSATTFSLGPETQILPAGSAEALSTGATVTVISPRDPSGGFPVAQGIVIHCRQGEKE